MNRTLSIQHGGWAHFSANLGTYLPYVVVCTTACFVGLIGKGSLQLEFHQKRAWLTWLAFLRKSGRDSHHRLEGEASQLSGLHPHSEPGLNRFSREHPRQLLLRIRRLSRQRVLRPASDSVSLYRQPVLDIVYRLFAHAPSHFVQQVSFRLSIKHVTCWNLKKQLCFKRYVYVFDRFNYNKIFSKKSTWLFCALSWLLVTMLNLLNLYGKFEPKSNCSKQNAKTYHLKAPRTSYLVSFNARDHSPATVIN